MLRASDLDYELPPGAIATRPAEPRDSARLMVVSRSEERRMEHRTVRDLPALLRRGDCLVFNTTRVLPARLEGVRRDTGGRVEGLYLGPVSGEGGPERWAVLLRGRRLREGVVVTLYGQDGSARLGLRLLQKHPEEPGGWIAEVTVEGTAGVPVQLGAVGRTPLPPYILKARRQAGIEIGDPADRAWYQTVFAEEAGSVAAPTAGLHFTPELLASLAAAGIGRAEVVLHVGTGTFRPVETEFVEQHSMHAEWWRVSAETARAIDHARSQQGRIIAVGSTSARALESFAEEGSPGRAGTAGSQTRLLITPGYRWCIVDGMLTNFHLPRSTLLAMVAALLPGGVARVKALYQVAIEHGYRFYSYGDAMLILP